MVPRAIRD